MGCDIHTVFQAKIDDAWVDIHVPCWDEPRSYALFGWLAGVRGDETPIAEPRGLPADFICDGHGYHPDQGMVSLYSSHHRIYSWGREESHGPKASMHPHLEPLDRLKYMGDHSFSWLTLSEINAKAMTQPECCGWFVAMTRSVAKAYDGIEVRMVMGFDS